MKGESKTNKNFFNGLKRSLKKLKYLDKTQSSYFVITTFIIAFCMFSGLTYSYFTFSKHLKAATITIAKLNYVLESDSPGYTDQSVTVPSGETIFLDLSLKSLNGTKTRYALNYEPQNKDANIKVYYSENLRKNTMGIIGAKGSIIDMRVVIENMGDREEKVSFNIDGGYVQNTLTSNITEGYFERDLTIRPHVYDENFDNPVQVSNFPEASEHSFFKVECTNNVIGTFDEVTWTLKRSDEERQTSCDVYFKKTTKDLEIFYAIAGSNETSLITEVRPDNNGLYKYKDISCSNTTDFTFDEGTFDFKVKNYKANSLCVINFETDKILENSDRYNVYFDANGGKTSITNKTVIKGGNYGMLPKPINLGNIFLGWFTDKDGGVEITSSSIADLSGDQTLFAHWQSANQVEVALNVLNVTPEQNVYSIEDDYGTSYYYKSNSENNYLKFANMYFRIIRINGDGSLRLLYEGKNIAQDGELGEVTHEKVAWNNEFKNDAKYVGYMYGGANGVASDSKTLAEVNESDSNVKSLLEKWYKENILDKGFADAIGDEIYCNDRSSVSQQEFGYGTNPTIYSAYNRLFNLDGTLKNELNQVLKCQDKNNAFTSRDNSLGNATLAYPIGLISADEISLIIRDALNNENNDNSENDENVEELQTISERNYLLKNSAYWTISPSRYEGEARVLVYDGEIKESPVIAENSIVPVINLSKEFTSILIGEGTIDNPYYIR